MNQIMDLFVHNFQKIFRVNDSSIHIDELGDLQNYTPSHNKFINMTEGLWPEWYYPTHDNHEIGGSSIDMSRRGYVSIFKFSLN